MRKPVKTMPIEVAAACGWVPEIKVGWWEKWSNRLQYYFGAVPPRKKVWESTAEDVPRPCPDIWNKPCSRAVVGSQETRDKLISMTKEIDRVMNQQGVEANQFWINYDARNEALQNHRTAPVPPVGTSAIWPVFPPDVEAIMKSTEAQMSVMADNSGIINPDAVQASLSKTDESNPVPPVRGPTNGQNEPFQTC